MNTSWQPQNKEPPQLKRLEKKHLPPFSRLLLPLIAALSAFLLTLALPGLIGAEGWIDSLKCLVIGLSAGITAYAINRYAIERGAVQAAIGSWTSGITSLISILVVGAGLAMATYAGLVIEKVDQLRLQQFSAEQSAWMQDSTARTGEASRLHPIVTAIASDLERNVACEAASSCVSGVGIGGQGPAYRMLLGALGRVQAIASELRAAEQGRMQTTSELSALQEALQSLLVDGSLPGAMRRLQAEQLTGRIGATAGTLGTASPASLVQGLARELSARGGNRPEDRLLASYGAQLMAALETVSGSLVPPPAFPAASGVADTLRYIGHFLPVALLVAVIELILPTTLWVYAVMDLRARLEEQERAEKSRPPARRKTGTPKRRDVQ